jgi:hypothetical protein
MGFNCLLHRNGWFSFPLFFFSRFSTNRYSPSGPEVFVVENPQTRLTLRPYLGILLSSPVYSYITIKSGSLAAFWDTSISPPNISGRARGYVGNITKLIWPIRRNARFSKLAIAYGEFKDFFWRPPYLLRVYAISKNMDFKTSAYARSRSRRSHTKSRLGCGNCKRRRIKVSFNRGVDWTWRLFGPCSAMRLSLNAPTAYAILSNATMFKSRSMLPQQLQDQELVWHLIPTNNWQMNMHSSLHPRPALLFRNELNGRLKSHLCSNLHQPSRRAIWLEAHFSSLRLIWFYFITVFQRRISKATYRTSLFGLVFPFIMCCICC